MEVMLIQMPVSIPGVLRGDGLKRKLLQQYRRHASPMPVSTWWKTGIFCVECNGFMPPWHGLPDRMAGKGDSAAADSG